MPKKLKLNPRENATTENKPKRKRRKAEIVHEQVRRRPDIPLRKLPPIHGTFRTTEPHLPEEEQLARLLADELNYAAAVVATNLDGCYPEKNAAGFVQKRLQRKTKKELQQASRRATEMLNRDPSQRQRMFGSYALAGARHRFNEEGMSDTQRGLLREIARKRVQAHQSELQSLSDYIGAGGLAVYNVCKSELEGILSEDLKEYYTQLTISSPGPIKLRWTTECEEAEVGVWEVMRLPSRNIVTTGVVPINTTFEIDFALFLSAQPPADPQKYQIRIRPHIAGKFEKIPGATPGSTQVVKTPPIPIAGYSNPIFIAYQKDDSEVQIFDEDVIYRNAELHIDHLHMVEQQSGVGADEYWLHGALMEVSGEEEAVAHELPKWFAKLNGAHNTSIIDYSKSFHLENPSSSRWPKVYSLLLTVMEEDGGEEIADTMQDIWNWVTGRLLGELFEEIKGFLNDIGLETWSAASIAAGLAGLAAALAGSVVGAVAGLVLAFAAGIIHVISQAAEDDFYESKSVVFALPTNTEDYVHQQVNGDQDGDRFRLKAEYPQFHYWTLKSIGAYDGLVEVKVHWELYNREDLALG